MNISLLKMLLKFDSLKNYILSMKANVSLQVKWHMSVESSTHPICLLTSKVMKKLSLTYVLKNIYQNYQ